MSELNIRKENLRWSNKWNKTVTSLDFLGGFPHWTFSRRVCQCVWAFDYHGYDHFNMGMNIMGMITLTIIHRVVSGIGLLFTAK